MIELAGIQHRIDALASAALEKVVAEAETKDKVKVTDVQVHVGDTPAGEPVVDVNVTVERVPTPVRKPV